VIFVDTSFFFPLVSAHDRDHSRVRKVIEDLGNRRLPDVLITTNHVVGETITLARVRGGHELAVQVGRHLYAEKMARIHWASPDQEKAAFEYLAKHRDKEYSFRHHRSLGGGLRLHAPIRREARPGRLVRR
jgi:uncharacterized protein